MPDTDRIKLGRTDGTIKISRDDLVIADSRDTVVLRENGYAPRHYFPRTDIDMSALAPSTHTTRCPFKGTASYFHLKTDDGLVENIAWSYEDPIGDVAEIKGLVAFYEEKLTLISD